jgi:drug/metabolite transporter (DMT)-like permease
MKDTSHLSRGYTYASISALFLSVTSILIRYLTQTYHLPALILAFWRSLFVFLILLPILAFGHRSPLRIERRYLPYLLVYGLMLAIFNSLWTLSVSLNGAAVSTVLAYCSAAFTALLGRWFLKETLDWGKLLAVFLSLAGCVLVSGALGPEAGRLTLLGIVTGILSGLWYAIYTLMGRSASRRGLNPWSTLIYTFGFGAFFLLAFNLFFGGTIPGAASRPSDLFWLGTAWIGWGILFLLAAGPTVLGFGLYNVSLTYLPSSVVNLIATLEPAFTAGTAYVLLGERMTWIQILGAVLILGGVVFLRIYEGWLGAPTRLAPPPTLKASDHP